MLNTVLKRANYRGMQPIAASDIGHEAYNMANPTDNRTLYRSGQRNCKDRAPCISGNFSDIAVTHIA